MWRHGRRDGDDDGDNDDDDDGFYLPHLILREVKGGAKVPKIVGHVGHVRVPAAVLVRCGQGKAEGEVSPSKDEFLVILSPYGSIDKVNGPQLNQAVKFCNQLLDRPGNFQLQLAIALTKLAWYVVPDPHAMANNVLDASASCSLALALLYSGLGLLNTEEGTITESAEDDARQVSLGELAQCNPTMLSQPVKQLILASLVYTDKTTIYKFQV